MKISHIVALILIGIGVAAIIGMSSDYSSYATFETARLQPSKEFRVIGNLPEDGKMNYDPLIDPNYFSFDLTDKKGLTKKVVFYGNKPRDFERSEDVVLTGKMNDDHFEASNILLKCPSKYVEDEIEIKEFKSTKKT